MSHHRRENFRGLRERWLPDAAASVRQLGRLADYAHNEQEAKALLNELADAMDDLDAVFAKKWGWVEDKIVASTLTGDMPSIKPECIVTARAAELPQGTAEGGASFEAEVRWAYDALKRNDAKLAKDRLARVLKGLT